MSNKFKVVRLGRSASFSFIPQEEDVAYMAEHDADLVNVKCGNTEEEVIEAAKDADIIFMSGPQMTRKVMESLPKCQAIIFGSVGYDKVDVDAATDNNIIVVNNPAHQWCVEEVSNHTIVLLLASAKKLVQLDKATKQGQWLEAKQSQKPMQCIHGQTLGLIGCGSIGGMTAVKAQCFNLKIIGYDPYIDKSDAEKNGITLVDSLTELLKQSDYVSAHTPLNDSTRHMLGEKEFGMMKPTAYFINTSRGPVVDETALIKALEEKWIAGAGLDVFEMEPIASDNPLLKMDNVTVFPHSASYSDVAFSKPCKIMMEETLRILKGKWPVIVVNESVKPKVNLVREE
ncbi:C-terminal binding protein [Chloroflexota bacterium]